METIPVLIKQTSPPEFEQIKKMVHDFWLDDENMLPEQFRILTDGKQIIAFGRLRQHEDATELCTLGVAQEFQGKGWGRKMVDALLKEEIASQSLAMTKRDVYLVTVIPEFFSKLGFTYAETYPVSLQKKVLLCNTHYHVGETYRVMSYKL